MHLAWDTETTGVDKYAEIVSIGWCSLDGSMKGEVFAIPTCPIHPAAFAIHGLCLDSLAAKGAGTIHQALRYFFDQIEMIQEPVLLVAHNGKTFDTYRLRLAMAYSGIQVVPSNVVGFADTLAWTRSMKSLLGCTSCSLDHLCKCVNVDSSARLDRHGALLDSEVLAQLLTRLESRFGPIPVEHTETVAQFMARTGAYANSVICRR